MWFSCCFSSSSSSFFFFYSITSLLLVPSSFSVLCWATRNSISYLRITRAIRIVEPRWLCMCYNIELKQQCGACYRYWPPIKYWKMLYSIQQCLVSVCDFFSKAPTLFRWSDFPRLVWIEAFQCVFVHIFMKSGMRCYVWPTIRRIDFVVVKIMKFTTLCNYARTNDIWRGLSFLICVLSFSRLWRVWNWTFIENFGKLFSFSSGSLWKWISLNSKTHKRRLNIQ